MVLQIILKEKIISIEEFFKNKLKIELIDKELELFLNGVKLNKNYENEIYRVYNKNKFIGLGIIENNKFKRDIII